MKKLISIAVIGVVALVVISLYATNHTNTVVRYAPQFTQEQNHAVELLEDYTNWAECEETTWNDLVIMDDSIWNFICLHPNAKTSFDPDFCNYIADEEYKVDSTYGWTDHYALRYRIDNNIHYWRFKMN